jgi:hypothetical protein
MIYHTASFLLLSRRSGIACICPAGHRSFVSRTIHHTPHSISLANNRSDAQIFHEFHIQLIACLMVKNREDVLAAHILTLQGRQELRELERGYSTRRADEPVANSLIDLKSLTKRTLILTLRLTMHASWLGIHECR